MKLRELETITPRWTEGGLAEAVAYVCYSKHRESMADAVERLTRAARAAVDYMDDSSCEALSVESELRAAIEVAENWGNR